MLVKNTKEEFGSEVGPWEVESKESFADEMEPCFKTWAREKWESIWDKVAHGEYDKPEETEGEFLAREIAEMRESFIDGLEEV